LAAECIAAQKTFKKGKTFLQVNCQTEVHRIELHEYSNKSFINVIHEGKKNTL